MKSVDQTAHRLGAGGLAVAPNHAFDLRRLFPTLSRFFSGKYRQAELISSLDEVADAVSSALALEDVLVVIVERAKRITDTDKAVLVLADEHGGAIDLETIIVRGRRGQHAQEWWQERLEELGEEVFASGEIVVEHHAQHAAWLACSPVRVKDHPIGLICAINSADRPFSRVHVDFLAILSAFAASAIENARLAEQSRYVLLASERDRIASEMHDGVLQSLFSISIGLELCKKQVTRDPDSVANRLEDLQSHLNTAMTELRRFIYDLRPMKLKELGLSGAIEYWIKEVTLGRETRGSLRVVGELPTLTPSAEACLYRAAKESVSNVMKHSSATEFDVTIECEPDGVRLRISDNGRGFDVDKVMNGFNQSGLGLRSIRQGVDREFGQLWIDSEPEVGTTVTIALQVGG